jgi:hypothetical protein
MYRIVKRIVHTITTVTWLVRWENSSAGQESVEEQITFPATYSLVEDEVADKANIHEGVDQSSKPISDEGEKS